MDIIGYVDRASSREIAGWIMNRADPEQVFLLRLIADGKVVAETRSDIFRGDVERRFGSGRHGFHFATNFLKTGKITVSIGVEGAEFDFKGFTATLDSRDKAQMVTMGKDGWLFLTNDSNNSDAVITGDAPLGAESLLSIEQMLEARDTAPGRGLPPIITYIIPERNVLCNDKRLQPLAISDNRPAIQIADAIEKRGLQRTLYGLDHMRGLGNPDYLFLKNDTHNTHRARLDLFQKVVQLAGADVAARATFGLQAGFQGDLGSKVVPPVACEIETVQANAATAFSYDEVTKAIRGDGVIRGKRAFHQSDAPNSLSCLLAGTSTAYYMRPLFHSAFRYVHFHWSISIDYAHLRQIRPDFVFVLVPERYIGPDWSDTDKGLPVLDIRG